jgi:hypothetical protein
MSGSHRVVKLITPTGCFQPCALVSAGTWKNPANKQHTMNVSQYELHNKNSFICS